MLNTSKYRQLASDLEELDDIYGERTVKTDAAIAILELVRYIENVNTTLSVRTGEGVNGTSKTIWREYK